MKSALKRSMNTLWFLNMTGSLTSTTLFSLGKPLHHETSWMNLWEGIARKILCHVLADSGKCRRKRWHQPFSFCCRYLVGATGSHVAQSRTFRLLHTFASTSNGSLGVLWESSRSSCLWKVGARIRQTPLVCFVHKCLKRRWTCFRLQRLQGSLLKRHVMLTLYFKCLLWVVARHASLHTYIWNPNVGMGKRQGGGPSFCKSQHVMIG